MGLAIRKIAAPQSLHKVIADIGSIQQGFQLAAKN